MDILKEKATVKDSELKRFFIKTTASELTKMAEPCYYPKLHKNYYDILKYSGLTNKDMRDFVKRFYKGHPAESWNIPADPKMNILIFLMNHFLNKNDISTSFTIMVYFHIRFYANMFYKSFSYCKPEIFKYTLEHLTRTHLFFREKGISNALYFLSKIMFNTYKKDIETINRDNIIDFIMKSRHRISQSIKSFAQNYYANNEKDLKIKEYKEDIADDEAGVPQQVLERGKKIIDQTTKKITIYKTIEKDIVESSVKLSKLKSNLTYDILRELSNLKYGDDISMILKLFLKNIEKVSQICGKDYFDYIKKLMTVKRTRDKIYFKKEINLLLIKILKNIKKEEEFMSLNNQIKFNYNYFLGYYITLNLRKILC